MSATQHDTGCMHGDFCADCEAMEAFIDWVTPELAMLEDQSRWYETVRFYGYAIPAPIWEMIEGWLQACFQAEMEYAELRAGWDPNP